MAFALNLLWFLCCGWLSALLWLVAALLMFVTVIGAPFGVAASRIASYVAWPFGRELVSAEALGERRLPGTGLANAVWIVLAGLWLAIAHIVTGLSCFLAFPLILPVFFGIAHFKIAGACFAPLGKRIVGKDTAQAVRRRAAESELLRRTSPHHQPVPQFPASPAQPPGGPATTASGGACSSCGQVNPRVARYCAKCGSALAPATT